MALKLEREASSVLDVDAANAAVDGLDARGTIEWAARTFGDGLVLSSSFGTQAAVMLHLATRVVPRIPVILLDTGFLFPETYRFVDELERRLDLNLHVYQPRLSAGRLEALHGELWKDDEAEYGRITKREPMDRALEELGARAWLAGLRRSQTGFRQGLRRVEMQGGRYKVHPILDWTSKQIHEYLEAHDLPYHPLWELGYTSIGDVHSTRPAGGDLDDRTGRFDGQREECGLHLPETDEENQSRGSSGL